MTDVSDGPAKITPLHVRELVRPDLAGGPVRYRNTGESPLTLAFHRGQLQHGVIQENGRSKYTSADRLGAADRYRRIWETCQASGRDSMNMDRVSGNPTEHFTIAQAEAIRCLGCIIKLLNDEDRKIVQFVCGEGWWPSKAVREACGASYTKSTIPRLNEALDHLIEAFGRLR
jgi:hypothetical protein